MKIVIGFQKSFDDNIEWYWKKAAKLINWWTKSPYFHVELAVDGKWIGAHTERGIEIHDYDPNHFSTFFDYYEINVSDISTEQRDVFWKWIEGEAGTGYDWAGIYLTQIVKLDWEAKDKWFCSEMTSRILQLLYVPEFIDCKPNRLSPQDIFNMLEPKLVKLEPHKEA